MNQLDVIIPVFNEANSIATTISILDRELQSADLQESIIFVVDDGSSDETLKTLQNMHTFTRLEIISQSNQGRFLARQRGINCSKAEWILLMDSRVHLKEGSLLAVRNQILNHPDRQVWNGHVETNAGNSLVGLFWIPITRIAWRHYFKSPQTFSIEFEDFDKYPKGTTLFLTKRDFLVHELANFATRFDDLKYSNDDTLLIRPIARKYSLWYNKDFACQYFSRTSLPKFIRHSLHRGTVFVDGHFYRGSRYFLPLLSLFAIAPLGLFLTAKAPLVVICAFVMTFMSMCVMSLIVGSGPRATLSFLIYSPVFLISYGLGVLRGLILLAVKKMKWTLERD